MKEIDKKPKVLNDDASIYQQRNEESMKKQISDMSLKEKLAYFIQYYGKLVLILLLVLIGTLYFLYSVFGPSQEYVLYIASINLSIDDDTAAALEEDLEQYLDLDELEKVFIDNSFFIYDMPTNPEETQDIEDNMQDSANASVSASSHMKISTYVAAKEIDIIIAPKSVFENYMNNGFFDSLDESLPTDIFAKFSDILYFGTSEESSIIKPYGIILDDFPYYQENKYKESQILGIVVNSEHKNNSISFLRYLAEKFDY